MLDENALLAAARRGEERACKQLVDQLYPQVIAIVRNHLPNSEEEQDLAQEIFMKVFTKLGQFDGRSPLEHWVSRVALNTCYDSLRSQRRRSRVVSYTDLDIDEVTFLERALQDQPAESSPESANELIEKLLQTLNPREQMAIRLLDLEEHSVQEVCDLTGWGASKVKVTAMRARRKLSKALERLEKDHSE
ncbi:MAG: RNA polymerase sigma-70 factor (ECF subfamily) [Verrucomicrobiales bacterium]|jgi:RNA polymerase sigma-70 factor (ECF subfamily)